MAESQYEVDLTTCDMEPIHVIGRIQSFGWLLSFSSDWIVNHVSQNVVDLFGVEPHEMIGMPASRFISASALHDIRSRLQMLGSPDSVERVFGVDLLDDGRAFDLAIHASGRSFIAEIEASETGRRRDYVSFVRPMIDRMRNEGSVEALCSNAARLMRGLTGFDRVMVYRFEPSGAGEVVAESLNGSVDSFHGLHFPASDIPAQARRLYARNILRIISDVNDPTVPILPSKNPSGQPLDLSMSSLRAVSPIHIEYLKNMGVEASMSVSIMRRGELWGLMACHHYSPLNLPYSIRTAAELFGEFFSFLLEQAETDYKLDRRREAMQLHDEIMARVAGGRSLIEAFEDFADSIGKVIPFDGIVGWVDGEFMAQGRTPDRDEFEKLARFLNTAGASTVWSTDNIQSIYPAAQAFADKASGLLALPVSRSPRDYIVLFRSEYLHTVHWAGNPEKPVELGPNGARLTPRKSFELWREERSGYSRPWETEEIDTAENLRVTLLEVVLRMTDEANAERQEASQRQDVLIAELNHRVRNILNLIRSLVAQSREGSSTVDEFADIIGSRIYALARAHDLVTRTDWAPSSFYELVRTEVEAYAAANPKRVKIEGPDVMIAPGAFSTLALVVHELMTNSGKYGALSAGSDGQVTVTVERGNDHSLTVVWSESGGPEVRAPERRGFGSTIIERMIPHELGGHVSVDFAPSGLVARLVLPAEHIASYVAPSTTRRLNQGSDMASPTNIASELLSGLALVVEDNVIIAMEAEDLLTDLGFDRCRVAGSVNSALKVIEDGDVRFAMLDVNLGSKTSEPIAERLDELGIPFIFASGYGDNALGTDRFAHVPSITKPYSLRDVRAAIGRLGLT